MSKIEELSAANYLKFDQSLAVSGNNKKERNKGETQENLKQ